MFKNACEESSSEGVLHIQNIAVDVDMGKISSHFRISIKPWHKERSQVNDCTKTSIGHALERENYRNTGSWTISNRSVPIFWIWPNDSSKGFRVEEMLIDDQYKGN